MKLQDILQKVVTEASAPKTFSRKVETYINKHFYVYDDKLSGDDRLVYVIEERKAKYEIRVVGDSVGVTADLGTGATRARAKEIKALLVQAGSK